MSNFVKHQPCPDCGSKDNCAVYDDGHEWCFGCGYYKGGVKWKTIERKHKPEDMQLITLPLDASSNISKAAQEWYRRYEITDSEANLNKFLWSNEKKWLIMPVYNILGQLAFFQSRCFGTGPKYFTKGAANSIDHIIGDKSNPILFLVEDMLSAIKISRLGTASPLFGSNISDQKLLRLSEKFRSLVIWLDYDKVQHSLELRRRAANIFKGQVYISGKVNDPKCINMRDLRYIVEGFQRRAT